MVEAPEPGGDVVSHHHVYGVVSAAGQQQRHARHAQQQRDQVQRRVVGGGVWEGEGTFTQIHCEYPLERDYVTNPVHCSKIL